MHLRDFQHKSLKHENIQLDTNDIKELNIRVAEFGFAAVAEQTTKATFVTRMNIDFDSKEENELLDVKSIGEIIFYCLTG